MSFIAFHAIPNASKSLPFSTAPPSSVTDDTVASGSNVTHWNNCPQLFAARSLGPRGLRLYPMCLSSIATTSFLSTSDRLSSSSVKRSVPSGARVARRNSLRVDWSRIYSCSASAGGNINSESLSGFILFVRTRADSATADGSVASTLISSSSKIRFCSWTRLCTMSRILLAGIDGSSRSKTPTNFSGSSTMPARSRATGKKLSRLPIVLPGVFEM